MTVAPPGASLAAWLRLEAELWTFALTGWLRRYRPYPGEEAFSHHRACHWSLMASLFIFLSLVEGTVVHLLLVRVGYETATIAALGLHAYAIVWILGDAQALRLTRSVIRCGENGSRTLKVHVGLRGQATVPVADIASVEVGEWERAKDGETILRVLGPSNLRLRLHRPIQVRTMLTTHLASTILVQFDEPEAAYKSLSSQ